MFILRRVIFLLQELCSFEKLLSVNLVRDLISKPNTMSCSTSLATELWIDILIKIDLLRPRHEKHLQMHLFSGGFQKELLVRFATQLLSYWLEVAFPELWHQCTPSWNFLDFHEWLNRAKDIETKLKHQVAARNIAFLYLCVHVCSSLCPHTVK